jgi:hypothetical protein
MLSKSDRSNLAGEFYTLSELFRRGYNAFITLGKGKQIDIVVKDGDNSLSIEVKARISSGQFLCTYPTSPHAKKIGRYVFDKPKGEAESTRYYLWLSAYYKLNACLG